MRRVCAVLVCCAVVQLMVPSRAYAWWDFLEEFSGAGPFKGVDVDVRLACFVDTSGVAATHLPAIRATIAAQNASIQARTAQADKIPSAEALTRAQNALGAWKGATQLWEELARLSARALIDARREAELLEASANVAEREAEQASPDAKDAANLRAVARVQAAADAYAVVARAEEALATSDIRAKVLFPGLGVVYSACNLKKGERRRGSIDFGTRFVWTHHDPRFANGTGAQIFLTTAEPAVSWTVFNPSKGPRWKWADWVDYGIGGGFYWVSSTEFPSFGAGFLEPVRFDVHAPTALPPWTRILVVRLGLLVFPGGFEPTAFGAVKPENARRIPRDVVKTISFSADLEPLLEKLR
jgi:hypothetical protein